MSPTHWANRFPTDRSLGFKVNQIFSSQIRFWFPLKHQIKWPSHLISRMFMDARPVFVQTIHQGSVLPGDLSGSLILSTDLGVFHAAVGNVKEEDATNTGVNYLWGTCSLEARISANIQTRHSWDSRNKIGCIKRNCHQISLRPVAQLYGGSEVSIAGATTHCKTAHPTHHQSYSGQGRWCIRLWEGLHGTLCHLQYLPCWCLKWKVVKWIQHLRNF